MLNALIRGNRMFDAGVAASVSGCVVPRTTRASTLTSFQADLQTQVMPLRGLIVGIPASALLWALIGWSVFSLTVLAP